MTHGNSQFTTELLKHFSDDCVNDIFVFLALNAHVDWGGKPHLKIASFQIYNDWYLIHPWWRATKCNTWIPESGDKPLNGFNMFSISLQHPTQDYFWYNDSIPIIRRQWYSYLEVQSHPQRIRLQRRLENKYDRFMLQKNLKILNLIIYLQSAQINSNLFGITSIKPN